MMQEFFHCNIFVDAIVYGILLWEAVKNNILVCFESALHCSTNSSGDREQEIVLWPREQEVLAGLLYEHTI